MRLRAKKGLLILLTAALTVLSVGCPNSTTITSGTGALVPAIFITNPTRWDLGYFRIDRVLVRPSDPGTNLALGPNRDISLLPFGADVDSSQTMVDPSFFVPIPLAAGTYEVTEIRYSLISFFDFDPTDPSTCDSFAAFYFPPGRVTINNFATPIQFTVTGGQDVTFSMTFDITQMTTSLNNAHTCSPGCGGWCISNFDPAAFAADTLSYLTFN